MEIRILKNHITKQSDNRNFSPIPQCTYISRRLDHFREVNNAQILKYTYTLSEAWSGVNWAPLGSIFMTGLPER